MGAPLSAYLHFESARVKMLLSRGNFRENLESSPGAVCSWLTIRGEVKFTGRGLRVRLPHLQTFPSIL